MIERAGQKREAKESQIAKNKEVLVLEEVSPEEQFKERGNVKVQNMRNCLKMHQEVEYKSKSSRIVDAKDAKVELNN